MRRPDTSVGRRWLVTTALLRFTLVIVSWVAGRDDEEIESSIEQDGARTVVWHRWGIVPKSRTEHDDSIRVTEDLQRELARVGLRLPPKLDERDFGVRRDVWKTQYRCSVSGYVPTLPKDVVDFYVRQIKGTRRHGSSGVEQMSAIGADGRSFVDVVAFTGAGRTRVDFGLTVPRP